MAILGKVAGSMLKDNLLRLGVDLQVDTDLMYFDMTNRRVGINTTLPGNTFVANGNTTLSNIYMQTVRESLILQPQFLALMQSTKIMLIVLLTHLVLILLLQMEQLQLMCIFIPIH